MLVVLRRLLGADAVSVDARVTQPPWREKRLLGGVDLVGRTHAEPYRIVRPLIVFRPDDAVSQYYMLESIGSGIGARTPITRVPLEEVDED